MTANGTSSHRAKRPYQPSIKNFFSRLDSYQPGCSSISSISNPSNVQGLPPAIQSSLLNVGMRVRKSVPEGYKTHKTVPISHQLYSPQPVAPAKPTTDPDTASVYRRPPELLPFCGLHKVGGLATPAPSSDSYTSWWSGSGHPGTTAALPGLWPAEGTPFSSQDSDVSALSTDSTSLMSHLPAAVPSMYAAPSGASISSSQKRRFHDFDADDGDEVDGGINEALGPQGASYFGFQLRSEMKPARRTAHARGRKENKSRPHSGTGAGTGTSGTRKGLGTAEFDFEDAAFLLPPSEVGLEEGIADDLDMDEVY